MDGYFKLAKLQPRIAGVQDDEDRKCVFSKSSLFTPTFNFLCSSENLFISSGILDLDLSNTHSAVNWENAPPIFVHIYIAHGILMLFRIRMQVDSWTWLGRVEPVGKLKEC